MQHEPLTLRTLKVSAVATIAITASLVGSSQGGWGMGFLIGALLSLFSFISLCAIVRTFFRTGAPAYVRGLLVLTFIMKLPMFALGLYLGTHLPGVQPMGMLPGIALVPTIMSLKMMGKVFLESQQKREASKQVSVEEPTPAIPELRSLRPARTVHAEPVREGV